MPDARTEDVEATDTERSRPVGDEAALKKLFESSPWDSTECAAYGNGFRAACRRKNAEIAELQASADLRWNADMRAIKRWQEAYPENDLVWPDHVDLVIWQEAEAERLRGEVERLQQLVQSLEWKGNQNCCPACGAYYSYKTHAPDCQLATALRKEEPKP